MKFLCFKFTIQEPPTPCPSIVLGFIAVFVQKVKIRTYGLVLNRDLVIVIKMLDNLVYFDSMGSTNS